MIGLLGGVRELGPLATDGLTPNLLPHRKGKECAPF